MKVTLKKFEPKLNKEGKHDIFAPEGKDYKLYKFVGTILNEEGVLTQCELSSTKEQPTWELDKEHEVEMTANQYAVGGFSCKIKSDKQYSGGGNYRTNPQTEASIIAQTAHKVSVDYINGLSPEEHKALTDKEGVDEVVTKYARKIGFSIKGLTKELLDADKA